MTFEHEYVLMDYRNVYIDNGVSHNRIWLFRDTERKKEYLVEVLINEEKPKIRECWFDLIGRPMYNYLTFEEARAEIELDLNLSYWLGLLISKGGEPIITHSNEDKRDIIEEVRGIKITYIGDGKGGVREGEEADDE